MRKHINMKLVSVVSVLAVLIISLSALVPASGATVIGDVVSIDSGLISGTVLGDLDDPTSLVRVYRGIPYAAPPVGDLRWKPPQPVEPWEGILECTTFKAWPPQGPGPWSASPDYHFPLSEEDCLNLNVLTPAKTTADKLPVMVWLHGGGLGLLSGTQPSYNYPDLPQEGVVLVTVSTRLGVLGLMAHPLLSAEQGGISGNYMFYDMIAALEWVQTNISEFGGDPDRVTIFGNSGGSAKCIILTASPLTEGLFHGFIGQSGSAGSAPLATLEAEGEALFAKLGITTLEEARALSWEEIYDADSTAPAGYWTAAVDGYFLTDSPANIFLAGEQQKVPFILGLTSGDFPGINSGYMDLFSGAAIAGVDAWAYQFDHLPYKWLAEGCAVAHATEVIYVFGAWDEPEEWNWFYPWSYVPAGAQQPDPGVTALDDYVGEAIMAMWVQFAETGDPNVAKMLDWPAYTSTNDEYINFAVPLEIKTGFSEL